jgi:hypothetical protein
LDIIYNVKPKEDKKKDIKPEDYSVVEGEESLMTRIIDNLNKTYIRYMIIGTLVSFFISFAMWQIFLMLTQKKNVVVLSSEGSSKHKKKKE